MVHVPQAEDQPVPERAVDEVGRQGGVPGVDVPAGDGSFQDLPERGAAPAQETVADQERLAFVTGGGCREMPQDGAFGNTMEART